MSPPGRGAIATLALRGPNAWEILRQLVTLTDNGQLPSEPNRNHLWFGRIGDQAHGRDEVVITARSAEAIEVHCHGGMEVVRMLESLFASRGAISCSWEEFEVLDADDPLSTQAKVGLARALTLRTAGILLDQSQGALSRALQKIDKAIASQENDAAIKRVDEILRYADVGTHLTRPWRVAIAGAPNVGKSTLINALAGFERSIVSPIPGTTRDVVTTVVAIDGWPVELIDTAGWRESADDLEREGIERGSDALAQADLSLWVVDASQPPVFPPALLPAQYVINKMDLPATWDLQGLPNAVPVSAKTEQGIDNLLTFVSRRLVPEPPPAGVAVPFSEAIVAALGAARQRLSESQPGAAAESVRTMLQRERETPARRG